MATETSTTLHPMAVTGRRVEFTYYRDLDQPDSPAYPGVITGTETGVSGALVARIRLDGSRSNLHIPAGYEGLRYLDEVGPVPELPMGRFIPVADDRNGFYERAGVLLAVIGEDGEEFVFLTDTRDKAREAAGAYLAETGWDLDYVDLDALTPRWVVFEWEPEDAECPWFMNAAAEGDDQALRVHYLPAA